MEERYSLTRFKMYYAYMYRKEWRGKRQCVDSTFIKANASMDSLLEKEAVEDASAFVSERNETANFT